MVLAFYMLPTVASAYLYGRRHATLTALASTLLVVAVQMSNLKIFSSGLTATSPMEDWLEIGVWGGSMVVTGYFMGSLYEHRNAQMKELGESYKGIMVILRHFISKDKYTENHCYRVSQYAAKLAQALGLEPSRVEDVRAAALLHDIGKLEVSREILHKAARLTDSEFGEMKQHVTKGAAMLSPVGGTLKRVLPIILAHHDKFDGSGYRSTKGEEIPLESRIIAVADVYDSLSSDRPYRKAMSPQEVVNIIESDAGTHFDPTVVSAFLAAFRRGEMEVSEVVL
jgi:putative nucleotidyltransferase with HDIG domain